MKHLLITIATLGLGLTFTACAADTAPTTDDAGDSSEDIVSGSGKKYHYAPIQPTVFWKPGCGVRSPDGHICENGLFAKFTRLYIDLQVTTTSTYDAATNTVTVKIDTWS